MNEFCYKPSAINHKLCFLVVGTNHKYSPVEIREKISFSKNRLHDSLSFLKDSNILRGAVILSTCNRVEVYASAESTEKGIEKIENFISRYHETDRQNFSPYFYRYEGKEAIKHLFSVACGLDSLILGERQILDQVRHAFLEAESISFTDCLLKETFNHAASLAKRVHNQTKISEGKVSVGSVAIDFIKEKIGTLSGRNILIIGVGKVTELVLNHLKKEKPKVVFVSNRTFDKARAFAASIGAEAVRFDNLKQLLSEADIVISATASPHFIIRKETIGEPIDQRLLLIDLALPRDIDPRVKTIKGVELFCLEDLGIAIKKNIERKSKEAERIEELIDLEVEKLWPRTQNYQEEFLRDPEVSLKK